MQDTPFLNKAAGTYTDTFTPTATGTWTVKTCKTGNAGACSVGNTLDTKTFTVTNPTFQVFKDFSDDNTADVTVSGYSNDPTCTATESPIPTGYTASGSLLALAAPL